MNENIEQASGRELLNKKLRELGLANGAINSRTVDAMLSVFACPDNPIDAYKILNKTKKEQREEKSLLASRKMSLDAKEWEISQKEDDLKYARKELEKQKLEFEQEKADYIKIVEEFATPKAKDDFVKAEFFKREVERIYGELNRTDIIGRKCGKDKDFCLAEIRGLSNILGNGGRQDQTENKKQNTEKQKTEEELNNEAFGV